MAPPRDASDDDDMSDLIMKTEDDDYKLQRIVNIVQLELAMQIHLRPFGVKTIY